MIVLNLAILAAIMASISSGIMGSFVVVKRISSITGSISHSILGGMGFVIWLKSIYNIEWLDPLHGAFVAALISAFLIGWVQLHFKQKEDAVIATIWSTGMALGIIFLILAGQAAHCTDFLFGDLFTIYKSDLWMLGILDIIILLITVVFYKRFLIICFDEEQALLQNISVKSLYFLLLGMIGISIVLLVQIMGIILVIALLAIPATIANLFTYKLHIMMVIAVILTLIFNVLGIIVSYFSNLPPGATIALITGIFYISILTIKKINTA